MERIAMAQNADILIVGGGVMGTSIAWALSKRQPGRIIVLEKSYLGAGSSGKSGAIIRQHYSNRLTAAMAQQGLRVFEHFPDIVGGPPVFTRTGMILIVRDQDRAGLEANLALQQELGIPTGLITRHQLSEIDPQAQVAEEHLIVHEIDAGYVEAVQVVGSFADAASNAGVDIRQGVEVKAILLDGDRIAGLETNEGRYLTRTLILATGPWAANLAADLGMKLPVQACRTQVALFRQPPGVGARRPVYGDFVQGIYFKPTHGEMIHVGSLAGEEQNNPVDPDDYSESADANWLPEMRKRLSRRYPSMHRGFGRGGYGALYAITPDWHPILDALPGIAGAYCAAGFSGHGFKLSPVIGRLMAELIVDGKATTMDITSLRANRFAENDPVRTPYSYGVMG